MVINISRLHLPIFGWRSFPITILNKIPWRMCLWVSSYSLHICIVLSNGLVLNRQQTIAWTTKASMGARSHQAFNRATYFQAKSAYRFPVTSGFRCDSIVKFHPSWYKYIITRAHGRATEYLLSALFSKSVRGIWRVHYVMTMLGSNIIPKSRHQFCSVPTVPVFIGVLIYASYPWVATLLVICATENGSQLV